MQTLTAAGVELVPFDSQALNDVSADAWGDNTESYAFEDTDTLARYSLHTHNHFGVLLVPVVFVKCHGVQHMSSCCALW